MCGNLVDKCYLIELSEEPETTNLPLYCKQAMPRLCPLNVRINSQIVVVQTLIVLGNILVIKIHDVHTCTTAHKNASQINWGGAHHIPKRNTSVLKRKITCFSIYVIKLCAVACHIVIVALASLSTKIHT